MRMTASFGRPVERDLHSVSACARPHFACRQGALQTLREAAAIDSRAASLNLRPLGLGELLDRAVHLYFRHFLTLTSLLIVVMIPFLLVQYFASKDILTSYFAVIEHAIKSPSSPPPQSDLQQIIDAANNAQYLTALNYALLLLALPLANAAVVTAVSRAYLGLPISFADCYRLALRRWLYVIILTLLWLIVLIIAVFGLVVFAALITVGVAAVGGLLATAGGQTIALIAAAIVGITLALLLLALAIAMYMAYACSFIAAVLEKIDPVRAFGSGFGRVFGGGQLGRSIVLALTLFAIDVGAGLVAAIAGGLLFYLTKSPVPYVLVAALSNLFLIAFDYVVVAVYYYDIRIRREGLDLQILAGQIAAASSTQPASA